MTLSFITLGLAATELIYARLLAQRPAHIERLGGTVTDEDYVLDDPILGYRPRPGMRATATKHVNDQLVYDVAYTINDDGWRETPQTAAADDNPPLVLCFGGSNMFGEGVNDHEALPAQIARLRPAAQVVNCAFSGYGPNQMLAMIETGRLDDLVRGRDVVAVYLYIDAHVTRVAGSMVPVSIWTGPTPCYEMNDAGQAVRRGSFLEHRRIRSWLYALLSRSNLVRYFAIDLPTMGDRHYALTARVVEQAGEALTRRSAQCRLYMMPIPVAQTYDRLTDQLQNDQVTVLDYRGLWSGDDPDYYIPLDWHPTPLAHRTLAQRLVEDILPHNRQSR